MIIFNSDSTITINEKVFTYGEGVDMKDNQYFIDYLLSRDINHYTVNGYNNTIIRVNLNKIYDITISFLYDNNYILYIEYPKIVFGNLRKNYYISSVRNDLIISSNNKIAYSVYHVDTPSELIDFLEYQLEDDSDIINEIISYNDCELYNDCIKYKNIRIFDIKDKNIFSVPKFTVNNNELLSLDIFDFDILKEIFSIFKKRYTIVYCESNNIFEEGVILIDGEYYLYNKLYDSIILAESSRLELDDYTIRE